MLEMLTPGPKLIYREYQEQLARKKLRIVRRFNEGATHGALKMNGGFINSGGDFPQEISTRISLFFTSKEGMALASTCSEAATLAMMGREYEERQGYIV